MSERSDLSPRPLKAAAVLLVAAAALSYGFVPERADNDVWWHLKTGKVIVESGLPRNDVFAFTSEHIRWHNHEWLAQVIFYGVFQCGGGASENLIGLRALIGFKALLVAATFLLVLVQVQGRCRCMPLAALITLLALDVSRRTLYPRPPIFTYLFLALFLMILTNWRARRWPQRSLLALPPLMLLWANLHGGFLVGLIVVAFYLVGEVAEHFFFSTSGQAAEEDNGQARKSRLRWLGGVLAGCVAASLCTPYGVYLYALPHRVMSSSALVKTIAEMRSPLVLDLARFHVSFFIMAALLVVGLGAARLVCGKRAPIGDLLILAFLGYEAVRHQRHLPLFAIATAPMLGCAVGHLLDRLGEARRRQLGWLAVVAVLLIAGAWVGVREYPATYYERNRQLARGTTYVEINFPKRVCDFLLVNPFQGRMFNPINCAGYLIWRLSPESHRVFTDSRFDVFGDQFVWHEFVVRHGIERSDWDNIAWERVGLTEAEGRHVRERVGSAGWSEILDQQGINFIVAERSWPGGVKLATSSAWELVFAWVKPFSEGREGYDVYVRRVPQNTDLIEQCRHWLERLR